MTTKGRSLAAAVLGVLVLACLFVSPAAASARAGASPAATASPARGVAPLGIGQRQSRDHTRTLPRRGAPEHSPLARAIERAGTAGQGPTLFAAVLGGPLLLTPLAAGFLAAGPPVGQVSRHRSGTRRDRAPPALALS